MWLNPRCVQFSTEAEANDCIRLLNQHIVREKPLEVMKFVPKSKREKPSPSNLYIKNFPADWETQRVEAYIKTVAQRPLHRTSRSMASSRT